ncbi:Adaptin N terminal region family protein [Histomonas meleagridis]|uniref:Adaptin N terminal region family protein n=1 Tax=Histomonas meleagridis TaxID=135588 RepID=UPI00355A0DB7|nr:Adaptin N terminal region family protein [Histomonas meleagridis]KAH0799781.1 Adaptin N terminal region family protein [Histomonas meleagridis]
MSSKNDEVLKQFFSNIKECLQSRDDLSIHASLKLLCGLLSRGFSLTEFVPLIAQHVVNDNDEVETLSQMLMVQLPDDDKSSRLQAVNSLIQASTSPKESRRIRAVKTLSSFDNPELVDIISSLLSNSLNDDSPYVKKAAIVGFAKLATYKPSLKPSVEKGIHNALESGDPLVISGAIYACEIIGSNSIIKDNNERIWPILLALDPWSQSRSLRNLLGTEQLAYKSILTILLHSQNPAVVFEATKYFEDSEPELIIPSLIRLIYSTNVISIHSFVILEKISKKHPQLLTSYMAHFSPPQKSEATSHMSVQILGNIGVECAHILKKWALFYNNQFAVHFLGKLGHKESLIELLKSANEEIAEIAAFYAAKIVDKSFLAQLLELPKIKAAVVSVFTDSCKDNIMISEEMLKRIDKNYNDVGREVKNEAALLAVRLADCNKSDDAAKFLSRCEADKNPDVVKRAKVLKIMLMSSKTQIKNAIWTSRDPPPPATPVIYIPELD